MFYFFIWCGYMVVFILSTVIQLYALVHFSVGYYVSIKMFKQCRIDIITEYIRVF